ncbi:MAG: hypothetical protein L0H93_02025 [Nocardioides sp.]|nr:hypothetical protein [Nocardioides sp.]
MSENTLTDPDTALDPEPDGAETAGDIDQEPAINSAEDPTPAPAKRRTTGRSRNTSRAGKASVRRIADKAEQIIESDEDTRALAAELVAARSIGVADLTTAIMEAKRSPVESAVADLAGVQSGSVPEATVHLVGMGRSELAALVQLVGALSDVKLPEKVPAKSTDAALTLVEPVRAAQIDQTALDQLQSLLAK